MNMATYICVGVMIFASRGYADAEPEPCGEVVMNIVPQFARGVKLPLPHVEVRRCKSGILDLAAWATGGARPRLTLRTNRSTVSQLSLSGNVIAFVLAGGTYDGIVVVRYAAGIPGIAYGTATKGDITIKSDARSLVLGIAEDGNPPQVKSFNVDIRELGIR